MRWTTGSASCLFVKSCCDVSILIALGRDVLHATVLVAMIALVHLLVVHARVAATAMADAKGGIMNDDARH